jgi:hypothetical protein
MALSTTKLDEYRQTVEQSGVGKWEDRFSNYGAFGRYLSDTPNLISDGGAMVAGRKGEDRTASFTVINRESFSASSSRTCTAGTQDSTSAYVTPSWTTWKYAVKVVPSQYENNYVSLQADFNHKMATLERTILYDLDTAAVTSLEANLSEVNNASGNPYAFASNISTVTTTDQDYFLNELTSQMMHNDLPADAINLIASPRFATYVDRYVNQGSSNDENRTFQFAGKSFSYSNQITVATTYHSVVYAAPPGSLGFLSWIDPDSRMNHESGDGKEWYTQGLPRVGIDVGVLYQSTCGDNSGLQGGLEASLTESYSFSFDYMFTTAYNSTPSTNPGNIFKFVLNKS